MENLLSKNCLVNVVTPDVKTWEEKTSKLVNKSRFAITDIKGFEQQVNYNYFVFCSGFINKENAYTDFKKYSRVVSAKDVKSLVIFPLESFSLNENVAISVNDNLSVIYLGDLLGPRMDFDSDLFAPSCLHEILSERTMTLPVGDVFYPIFVADAARVISKWLFSFGPYGKEVFLLGSEVSASTFWKENRKIVQDVELVYDKEATARFVPRGYEVKYVACNLALALTETYRWAGRRRKVKKTRNKLLRAVTFLLVFLFLLPVFASSASLGLTFLSFRQFVKGKDEAATNMLLLSKTFFTVSEKESKVLSHIPVLGKFYKELAFVSLLGKSTTSLAVSSIPAVRRTNELVSSILGDEVYDPTPSSLEIQADMEFLYQNISLIQLTMQEQAATGVYTARKFLEFIDFDRFKKIALNGGVLAGLLPEILGQGEGKDYLVLFQNNMELRPTGGFIGSFGMAAFDSGRLNELVVNDVYSADGQLKGHVEPPAPIRDYLGEAGWYLRDSNWDPDFPTSALRAEWFLDKEMDKQVDGVIGIDLKLIKDVLKITGPVFLPDYNMDITSENLYEKTQAEVEEGFFPGTHKKAGFLTELSRVLLSETEKLSNKQRLQMLAAIAKNLDERHVQIYLHDDVAQNSISSLNWGGQISMPTCGEGCYADFLAIVEANVGVNKSNLFVQRKVNFASGIFPGKIVRKMTLNLDNTANPALGRDARYFAYIRILVPDDADNFLVKRTVGEGEEVLSPDITEIKGRKEVGVITEVLAGRGINLEFTWQSSVPDNIQSYGLYIRKQAGVSDDLWTIGINGALTGQVKYSYNTTLARDFLWKQKH